MARTHWTERVELTPDVRRRVNEAERERLDERQRRLGAVLAFAALVLFMLALALLTADVWADGRLCGNPLSSADAGGRCTDALDNRRVSALTPAFLGVASAVAAARCRWRSP
jgi:hypothetical protein